MKPADADVAAPECAPRRARASTGTLSLANAAERMLALYADRHAMHDAVIASRVRALGLLSTAGQNPASTLYAQPYNEFERSIRRGDAPRFMRQRRWQFGLNRWRTGGLAQQIEQHNRSVRADLLRGLLAMPPGDFEALVGRLLVAPGFKDVAVTDLRDEGGIDVRGTLVVGGVIRTTMAAQAKRWTSNVQAPIAPQIRGSLGAHDQGLIITTSDINRGDAARRSARTASPWLGCSDERGAACRAPGGAQHRRPPSGTRSYGIGAVGGSGWCRRASHLTQHRSPSFAVRRRRGPAPRELRSRAEILGLPLLCCRSITPFAWSVLQPVPQSDGRPAGDRPRQVSDGPLNQDSIAR